MNIDALFADVYAAFNRRDAAATLARMSEDVSWPKASEGGRVVGKREIAAYWTRQWAEYDPRVDVIEVVDRGAGTIDVKVRQLVKTRAGEVLSDTEVWHVYTIANGLIARMELKDPGGSSSDGPSAAFARRGDAD